MDKQDLSEAGPSGSYQQDSSSEYTTDSSPDEDSEITVIKQELTNDYENELENDLKKTLTIKRRKEKRSKVRKPTSKLPTHLKGLMGESNLRFARGENEIAEKMCYEVIRQEPHAFEPYITLSQLYESSHPEKSMQYLTIAAHLSPSNVELWLRLAQLYVYKENRNAAVTCLTRAIQAEPKNYDLHNQRIKLLEGLNDNKFALRCKIRLLQVYSKKHYPLIMESAKELAAIFHKEKDYAKAVEIFSVPFTKCRKHITPEMVNIYLELLLLNENYPQCLDVFVQFCGIEIEIMLDDNNKVNVLSYNMPDGVQIDLCIKFIVCLIKLESYDLVDKLLNPYLMEDANAEKIGDLYLDVAEAYMTMNRHSDALKLLIPLIKSNNFSLAAVWLKYADCLRECAMYDAAIDSYFNVIRLAPQHIEVRYPLAKLLIENNRAPEALDVLNQEATCTEIDVGLLIMRMNLLKDRNLEEYFNSLTLLLKRHCIIFTHESEIRSVTFQETSKEKVTRINKQREFRGEAPITQNITSLNEPSIEEEYKIYRDCLSFCYNNRYFSRLKQFAFYGLGSSRFKNYTNEIMCVALLACLCTKDSYHAYPIIRDLILRKNNRANNLLWNIFNLTMQTQDEFRQNRFLMRQNKMFLRILEANNALSSGSYKIATIYLMPFLKLQPTPFIYLLLGVVFLQLTCQKHREIKKKLTQCSYGLFLNYANKRGKAAQQEVCYNLGRLYHQYGVLHIASYYYNLVLNFKHPIIEKYPDILDLKREAAFNLCLIYRDSENYIGARNLIMKYLTI